MVNWGVNFWYYVTMLLIIYVELLYKSGKLIIYKLIFYATGTSFDWYVLAACGSTSGLARMV